LRQFILPEEWEGGETCLIEGGRARYLARVLRMGPGDVFPALDARGLPWICRVLESGPDRLLLGLAPDPEASRPDYLPDARGGGRAPEPHLEDAGSAPPRSSPQSYPIPRIVLAMGLPKGAKMDLIVRQATETGVAAIVPIASSRSLVGARTQDSGRQSRWERIAREAMQQSGSRTKTRILEAMSLFELPSALEGLGIDESCPKVLLHEAPLAQSSMHGYLTGAPAGVALCVGPEGGFARDEVDFLLEGGFRPMRLPGAVLRAETAALYAIAAAQIILSESSSWIPKPL
jgi:16S rRNA (uracil1498-N3)-methyltransferase